MSGSALNIGLSGMKSYQRALDSTSFNVANANTSGFKPQQVTFQEVTPSGVVVNISQDASNVSESASASGTDLATELVNSMQYQAGFDFSAQIVKTADEVLGTLIDISA
jgi:flagellar hook protein FlgE